MPATVEREHLVTVTVDGKPVSSPRDTTAGSLLRAAGLDPASRELVRVDTWCSPTRFP